MSASLVGSEMCIRDRESAKCGRSGTAVQTCSSSGSDSSSCAGEIRHCDAKLGVYPEVSVEPGVSSLK
eukprot:1600801-Alexandrium_andersonii.AAC.1